VAPAPDYGLPHRAFRSLWPGFTDIGRHRAEGIPTIVRGDRCYVFDARGNRFFDAISGLFCVNVGYGRESIANAVADQLRTLSYVSPFGYASPAAVELAEELAARAPNGFGRVFFTSGGSEAVETAWKLTRQYHGLRGHPEKTGLVARTGAYHGTTLGALSVTGVDDLREPFGPLLDGVLHVPAVNPFGRDTDALTHSLQCADATEEQIVAAGPDLIGAIMVEPVQNSGGSLVAEPAHFTRLRQICDRYDLLLISDETICSFGRLGTWFGSARFGYEPDIITTAKGMTSGYAPAGAVIASERVAEPFLVPGTSFRHGLTFGGHPGATAAALENIRIIEAEGLLAYATSMGLVLEQALRRLEDIAIVGDVRGAGLFMSIELVPGTGEAWRDDQIDALCERLPSRLLERGLICRSMNRRAPLLQFGPPLIINDDQVNWIENVLRETLEELSGSIA